MHPSASESQKSLPAFSPLLQTRPLQAVPIQSRSTTSTTPGSGARASGTRLSSLSIHGAPGQPTIPKASTPTRRQKDMPAKRGQGVANYNELKQRENQPASAGAARAHQQPQHSTYSHQAIPITPYSSAVVPGTGSSNSSSVIFTRNSVDRSGAGATNGTSYPAQYGSISSSSSPPPAGTGFGSGSPQPGFMEGPLPSEVREIIRRSCTGEKAEEAEREARRLLSTSRRLRVYREEMAAAQEEMSDAKTECDRQNLVTSALTDEIHQINQRIEELMKERSICEQQLSQMQAVGAHREKKFSEARERVNILGSTIDNINRETSMGYLMLRQLVPNLNIENYA